MEMTNNGELSVAKPREYPVVEDGTWEAAYMGYKPFTDDGQFGHKEGVRLQFKISKGPFVNQYVSMKGNFFQDEQTGKWLIGGKSKLAGLIRTLTGGSESLTKAHEGTKVFVTVVTKVAQTSGKRYSNVTAVIPMPKDYAGTQTATPPAQPAAAPAAQQTPKTQPAAQQIQKPAPAPQQNRDLLDDLSDLSDFK